jgi:hypothetical protein
MEFALGVVLFLAGSGLVALCLVAIPGPPQTEMQRSASSSHHPAAH